MEKKFIGIVVALLLLIQTAAGGLGTVHASSSDRTVNSSLSVTESVYGGADDGSGPATPVIDERSILTKVVLYDRSGSVIDAVYNPDSTLDIGETVKLSYEWALPNGHDYKDGDTFVFDLPWQFEIFNEIEEPLVAGDDTVGRFTVDENGKVVITFNDYVENHSNISGKLEIWTEFRKEIITGSTEVIIKVPVRSGEQTVIVNLKPQGGKAIDKQGAADGKDRINWTVRINTTLDRIRNAVVTDAIPEGLKLIDGSVELYRLQVNVDGSTRTGDKVEADKYSLDTHGGSRLELAFADEISQAYEIRFSTELVGERRGESARFKNIAVLSGDDRADAEAEATVTVEFGKFLDKSADVDPYTGIVTWTVKYNFNEQRILQKDAVIADQFSDNHTYMNGSLEVYHGSSTDTVPVGDYTVTPETPNGFKLQFNKDIDSPYTIVYRTQPVDRLKAGEEVKNRVESGDSSKEVTVPSRTNRALVKERGRVDYKDKTVAWTVTINGDKKPDGSRYKMDHVTIVDTFPYGGLKLIADTVVVKQENGEVIKDGYTITDKGLDGFEIAFADPIDETYTIEYKTHFNVHWLKSGANFQNKVTMTWVENGENQGPIDRHADFYPDDYTMNNGAKDGSYDAVNKEITWNIKMNYNLDELDNAEVTDVVEPGQTFVPGSVKVYEMELTGSWQGVRKGKEVSAGEDYNIVQEPSEENGHKLIIEFNKRVTSPYWIEFKTSLHDELIVSKYENTAKLWDGSEEKASWKGAVTVTNGGKYVSKSGAQNGNKIEWTIRINEGQSHISNAKVVDAPSENQILIEDSFRLYGTKIDSHGHVTKDESQQLVKGTDYTLEIHRGDQETFELTFANDISRAYILEYQSFITSEGTAKASNKVKLEGDQLTTETRETTQEITVRTSAGSGSGGGVTGSLEVTKVDKDDPARTLAGAMFALSDKGNKRAPLILTTDEDGKILFTKLLYDDYILEELVAPEGYEIEQATWDITIDSSIRTDGNMKTITITNRQKPDDPTEPTDPTDPTDPDRPRNPKTPTRPGDPSDPGNPDDPTDVEPEQPSDDPGDPDTPDIEVEVPDEDIPRGEPTTPPTDGPVPPESPTPDPTVPMLPKTGEASRYPFYVAGLGLIAMSVWIGRRQITSKQ